MTVRQEGIIMGIYKRFIRFKPFIITGLFVFLIMAAATPGLPKGNENPDQGKKVLISKLETQIALAIEKRNTLNHRYRESKNPVEKITLEKQMTKLDLDIEDMEKTVIDIDSGESSEWLRQSQPASVGDDEFEDNDTLNQAAQVSAGLYNNLKLYDDDWYKIYVSAGKDLKVSIQGTFGCCFQGDIDVEIYTASGKLIAGGISSRDDETVYAPDLSAGWYYIKLTYFWGGPLQNIYSLQIQIGTAFGEGKITGRVTDDGGTGIGNLWVQVHKTYNDPGPGNYSGSHEAYTMTDANGNYSISLTPRDYKVWFVPIRTGLNYIYQYYNGKTTYDDADVVTVPANQTASGIDAQLFQGATIRGNITDGTGAPLESVYARPFNTAGDRVGTGGRTNSDGDYTAYAPAGTIKLLFHCTYRPWRSDNARYEWYDDKAFFTSADTMTVQQGQTVAGIDAQLAGSYGTISGRVTNGSGDGIEYVRVSAYETSRAFIISAGTDENGDYVLGGLPAGNFKINFYAEGLGYADEWYNNKSSFETAGTVAVTVGNDTPDIDAQLAVGGANNPPSVSIAAPLDGAGVAGQIDVQVLYSDDYYGLSRFELWWDSQLLTGMNGPNISPGGYATVIDTTAYSNGNHTVKAVVIDSAAQTAQHSVTVTVDNPADLPPTVSLTIPPGNSTVSGTVTVTADAADDAGIDKVEFLVDGSKIGEDTSAPYRYDWDTTAETNDTHTVKAVARDTAAQTAEHQVSVTVANTGGDAPPTVTVTSPTDGSGVTGLVTIEADAADDAGVSSVTFYVDGTLVGTDNNAPYQTNWDSADFFNGNHFVQAVATDTAGQTGRHQVSVTIGNVVDEPPVLHISNLSASIVSGTINIETFAEDDHGISKTEFYLDNVKIEQQASANCVFTWDTTAYSNQVHHLKFIAYDTSNYRSIRYRWVIVHNISGDLVPEIGGTTVSSTNGKGKTPFGAAVSGTLDIEVSVSDDNGIAGVEFYIDGVKKYSDTVSPYRYRWDTTQYSNGTHTFGVVVYDTSGQTAFEQENVEVDNGGDTAPTITLISPGDNETVSGDMTAAAGARDDKGVTKVEFYVDNALKHTDSTAPYQFRTDTAALSEGSHFVKGKVYDTAGKTAEHQVNITVDNTEEEVLNVSITSPHDGADVSGTVNIIAGAGPSGGVSKVEFYIDGVKAGEDPAAPYQYSWNTSTSPTGSHTVQAVAHGTGGETARDSIDVNVVAYTPPAIGLGHTQLNFGYVTGGTAPPSQSVLISGSGTAALDWTAASGETWIGFSPPSGTGNAVLTVTVNPAGLAVGTYTGSIVITDPAASNSPQTVAVSLKVYKANTTTAPFGTFSTPEDGSTVSSSIPVTGWVLDDIGVESVNIYRKEGQGMVFVGDAILVEGARPDVEEAYPGYPMNYKAGWGYMMLTNFLPDGGNGTFTIYAKAVDMEGKVTTLGSKTITCDNANAVKPFGAIDTPLQGGTAAGSGYINWGWVLTPQPNSIPTDGSTIGVYIDGVALGHPHYNIYRSDISTLFPGYANSEGAVGYLSIDTTAYENGIHTIFWIAEDTADNADGIGSRYFSVANTAGGRVQSGTRGRPDRDISSIPVDLSTPARVLTGYETAAEPVEIYPGENGDISISIRELDRLEVRLSGEIEDGYGRVGDRLRGLPIGSALDREGGIFYWHPGAGFLGEHRFVFIVRAPGSVPVRTYLTVTVAPRND